MFPAVGEALVSEEAVEQFGEECRVSHHGVDYHGVGDSVWAYCSVGVAGGQGSKYGLGGNDSVSVSQVCCGSGEEASWNWGGISTLVGKNKSCRIWHFPWKSLIPLISGSACTAFLLSAILMALNGDTPLALLNVFSLYFHWSWRISLLYFSLALACSCLYFAYAWSVLAFLFPAAKDSLWMVISGVHYRLLLAPGLLHETEMLIASWMVWRLCGQPAASRLWC